MKSASWIEPTDWMRAAPTRKVVDALRANGQEIRFVGGCVRAALLERRGDNAENDIDIATPDPPQKVVALLDHAGINNIPTGLAHGTVTALVERRHFEITTLRIDVKTHGRHAEVAFTDDWQQDAARRDFTMNALTCTPEGELYDPWDGVKDLKAGRVRFIGDAVQRIEEDHLRLLRFFRFHAWYGRGAPDNVGLAACAAQATLLHKLSGERIQHEMLKLLAAPDPAQVIEMMAANGVLAEVVPNASDAKFLRALLKIDLETEPLRRLAALMRPTANATVVHNLAKRWRLSNNDHERLAAMLSPPAPIGTKLDRHGLRRELYAHGAKRVIDWLLLAWCGQPDNGDGFRAMIEDARLWQPITLPVKGADALALGIPAGPDIGTILRTVERWWTDANFAPTRGECLEKLRAVVAAHQA